MRLPPAVYRFGGLLGSFALRGYASTLNSMYWFASPELDPKSDWTGSGTRTGTPLIYAFWHEYILFPVCYFGHCRVATLTSRHRDAELATQLSQFMGFKIFRGSTNHGGAEALRHLMSLAKESYHLTLMPDGPKGPRRNFSLGAVFMASRLGFPLVPAGMGYDRPWRLHSWDRFAIPRPYSRVRMVFPEAILVPPKLRRDELEDYRALLEKKLLEATADAEAWAASGHHRPGERVLDGRAMRPLKYRVENLHD